MLLGFHWVYQNTPALVFFVQEMSNKEIDLTYKLKVLQQELEQGEASHKATRALLADKSQIKVTIEGAKSESMKGEGTNLFFYGSCSLTYPGSEINLFHYLPPWQASMFFWLPLLKSMWSKKDI